MIYEAIGKVAEVGATQTFGSGFTKRSLVVDMTEAKSKFPNIVKFDAVKDGCADLDGLKKGDDVKVRFALNGRQWDGQKGRQYFVDLRIVRVERIGDAAQQVTDDAPDGDMPF